LIQDESKLKEERKVEKGCKWEEWVGRGGGRGGAERGSREGEREERERKWIDHSTLQLQ